MIRRIKTVGLPVLLLVTWSSGCGGGIVVADNDNNTNNLPDCGNGVVDTGEACDGAALAGQTCESLGYPGGDLACSSTCGLVTDGCVRPDGCGNGVLDPTEECDGANLGGMGCETLGFDEGTLSCTPSCRYDVSACTVLPTCGNGQLDDQELCDGILLGGQTCEGLGYDLGTLSCTSTCQLDLSACEMIPLCGNGVLDPVEECDDDLMGGETCAGLGWVAGSLACLPDCTYDESACLSQVCGNGVREGTEACDTLDLGGQACDDLGWVGGVLGCTAGCAYDESACTNQVCGNGIIETPEECDDTNLSGQDCTTLGLPAGTLACSSLCTFNVTGCGLSCAGVAQSRSHYGCSFYAVDLPNYNTDSPFELLIRNPTPNTATVTITTSGSTTTLNVPAGGSQAFTDTTRAQNVATAGVSASAFHVVSDVPVAVTQMNNTDPADNTTDSSLLLPDHALGTLYYTMDYDAYSTTVFAYIAVYATVDNTTVNIYPTAAVDGQTVAVVLNSYDVLLVTTNLADVSLTGSRVEADQPIGVFAGSKCSNVPAALGYCDHLEQQIFPRKAWDTHYVVPKAPPRPDCNEADQIRILADAAGTTVTLNPALGGPYTLNAGDWQEVAITQSVEITATHPVMVGQFLHGGEDTSGTCSGTGDPSFLLVPPLSQLVDSLAFTVPSTFSDDYLNIIAPPGATVLLDSVPVTLTPAAVGTSGYSVTDLSVASGSHLLQSNLPFTALVYGYNSGTVSYGHPLGLYLQTTNPVE